MLVKKKTDRVIKFCETNKSDAAQDDIQVEIPRLCFFIFGVVYALNHGFQQDVLFVWL